MVLQDCRLARSERLRDLASFVQLDRDPAVVGIERVIVVEGADVLRDGIERASKRGKGTAIGRMSMCSADGIRPRRMNAGMNGKSCRVDGPVSFQDLAVVTYSDQSGDGEKAEMQSKRVDPEGIGEFRIACSDMTDDALVEAELRKQAKAGRKSLLAM